MGKISGCRALGEAGTLGWASLLNGETAIPSWSSVPCGNMGPVWPDLSSFQRSWEYELL